MKPIQEIVVKRIVMHPGCRPEPDWKNDLALLEMQEKPQINGNLGVIIHYEKYGMVHGCIIVSPIWLIKSFYIISFC